MVINKFSIYVSTYGKDFVYTNVFTLQMRTVRNTQNNMFIMYATVTVVVNEIYRNLKYMITQYQ